MMRYYIKKVILYLKEVPIKLVYFLNKILARKSIVCHGKKKNPVVPLDFTTYDGGGQTMHPKMLYFENGWCGYKFWLCTTPYKDWNDYIENPCIYMSNDGVNYLEYKNNPIDSISGDASLHYNSDPHLVYNNTTQELECWWRFHKTQKSGEKGEIIFRRKTKDGINWQDKELLYESKGTELACLSPVVIYDEKIYKIWVSHGVKDTRKRRVIKYYESVDGRDWKYVRDINIHCRTHDFSHMDIIRTKEGYEAVLQALNKATGKLDALMYSKSKDNIEYQKAVAILERGDTGKWDDYRLYRPSLTVVNNQYYLYYGATGSSNGGKDWGTGLLMFENMNELITSI